MKISIITINYNNIEGLKQTVESVLSQTYLDKEYIVIDGGSKDGAVDFLKCQNKITYWVSEKDGGLYNAMNKGIRKLSGDYVIFMNSGDVFFDRNVLSDIFNGTVYNADVLYGSTIYKYGNGGILRNPRDLNVMSYELPFCHQSCFIKCKLMKNIEYDESYKLIADYNFFYQGWKKNWQFVQINKIVAIYDTTGISADSARKWQIYVERCKIHGEDTSLLYYNYLNIKSTLKCFLAKIIPVNIVDLILHREKGSNSIKELSNFKQIK